MPLETEKWAFFIKTKQNRLGEPHTSAAGTGGLSTVVQTFRSSRCGFHELGGWAGLGTSPTAGESPF